MARDLRREPGNPDVVGARTTGGRAAGGAMDHLVAAHEYENS
ncbi:hypothetical protein ABZ446_38720 [Streptomyces sp. NPDC005813]